MSNSFGFGGHNAIASSIRRLRRLNAAAELSDRTTTFGACAASTSAAGPSRSPYACRGARASSRFTSTRCATSRSSFRDGRRRTRSTRCCSSIARGSSASSRSRRSSSTSACSATTSCGSAGSRCRCRRCPRSTRGTASRRASSSRASVAREARRLGVTYTRITDSRPAHALGLVLEGRRALVQLAADPRAAGDPHLRRRARALSSHPPRPLRRLLGRRRRGAPDVRGGARVARRARPGAARVPRAGAPRRVATTLRRAWSAGRHSTVTARSWTGTRASVPWSATSCCRATTSSSRRCRRRDPRDAVPRRPARGRDAARRRRSRRARALAAGVAGVPRGARVARGGARRGWKLAILSNTDRDFIEASMASIGVPFELAIVASEIGSYKPALGHWRAFEERVGRLPDVHVAASHFHDVVPRVDARHSDRLDQPARGAVRAAADARAARPRRDSPTRSMSSSPDGCEPRRRTTRRRSPRSSPARRPLDAREVRSWFANPTFDPANDFRVVERDRKDRRLRRCAPRGRPARSRLDRRDDPEAGNALLDWAEERARAAGLDRLVA